MTTMRRTTRSTVIMAAISFLTMLSSVNASSYALKRKRMSEIEWPAEVVAITEPPRPTGTWWVRKITPTRTMTTTTTTIAPTTQTTIVPTTQTTKRRRTHRRRPKHRRNRGRKTTTRVVISKTEIIVRIEGGTDGCSTAVTTPGQVPKTVTVAVPQNVDTRFVGWYVFTYTLQSTATVLIASLFLTVALYCFVRDRCWRPLERRGPAAMGNMLFP